MPFIDHKPPGNGWVKPKCRSPEHDPPGMIVLKPGAHIWECPACGHETTVHVDSHTLSS